jgi:hypothetical protein
MPAIVENGPIQRSSSSEEQGRLQDIWQVLGDLYYFFFSILYTFAHDMMYACMLCPHE